MKQHVFLSYCREDISLVAELRQNLIAAGEKVWWDQDLLPGQDWKLEIKRALGRAYAVVACFSENTEKGPSSGIFPELRDAIEIYRKLAPGHVFLSPIRFSDCSLPDFQIDANRYLTDLQYVDFFPATQKKDGLAKLIAAVAAAPDHP